MSDPTQDPDFMAASPSDQMRYLSQTDPDFAKANPVDQLGYIAHIRGVSPVQGIQPPAQPQMQGSVLGASNPSAGNDTPVGKIPSSISNRTPDWTDNVVGGAALGGAALMGGAAIPGGTAAMSRLGKAAVSAGGTMAGITAMDWAMNNIPGLKNLPAGVKAAADYIPLFMGHGNAPPYAGKSPAPNPSAEEMIGPQPGNVPARFQSNLQRKFSSLAVCMKGRPLDNLQTLSPICQCHKRLPQLAIHPIGRINQPQGSRWKAFSVANHMLIQRDLPILQFRHVRPQHGRQIRQRELPCRRYLTDSLTFKMLYREFL